MPNMCITKWFKTYYVIKLTIAIIRIFCLREIPETHFPASVSIDTLLNAEKLVQPTFTEKAVLNFERFEIETATWKNVMTVGCKVESVKFSSGAFQDTFYNTTVQVYK